jgi:hypothetical protein
MSVGRKVYELLISKWEFGRESKFKIEQYIVGLKIFFINALSFNNFECAREDLNLLM